VLLDRAIGDMTAVEVGYRCFCMIRWTKAFVELHLACSVAQISFIKKPIGDGLLMTQLFK